MGKKCFPNLEEFKKLIIKCAEKYKAYPSARMIFKEYDNIPKSSITIKNNYNLDISEIINSCNITYEKKKIYSDEQLIEDFIETYNYYNKVPTLDEIYFYKENVNNNISHIRTIIDRFGSYDKLIDKLNLNHNKIKSNKYKEEFLLNELKRFVNEFNKIPIPTDFDKLQGYPSRKTFTNNFGTFNNALKLAGFEPTKLSMKEKINKFMNKDYLISELKRYVKENNKNPRLIDFYKNKEYPSVHYYEKVFSGWNNALIEAGLPINQVLQHDDDFLQSEFNRFFEKHGRIPTYAEFNNSEYPSFWCYQNRFGSWNNAVIAYGYEPNDKDRKYILDDGEVCASSYEFDVSMWLRNNNFKYIRNRDYKDFIDGYKGKMNCDYLIDNGNDKLWYVEIAGFLKNTNFNKFSQEERNYFFKLKYKRKLLKKQPNLNSKIIYSYQLKSTPLPELFSFLFD